MERLAPSARAVGGELHAWTERAGGHGIAHCVLRVGEPTREIVAAAEGAAADLVVLSTHDHGAGRVPPRRPPGRHRQS